MIRQRNRDTWIDEEVCDLSLDERRRGEEETRQERERGKMERYKIGDEGVVYIRKRRL